LRETLLPIFLFKDSEYVEKSTRMLLGGVLSATTGVGIACMFLLRPTPWIAKKDSDTLVSVLKDSAKLLITRRMMFFAITMFFTGLQQAFWGGVYATSIGFTEEFGQDRKALAGLTGVIVAGGEVTGGILFGFLSKFTVKRGRDPIILLGFLLSMTAYFLMFLNLPMDASVGETSAIGYISPSRALALGTGFILGFADACLMTQVTAMLAGIWVDHPASAFGLFKFVQSLASCFGFIYSGFGVGFYWQLLLAVIFNICGTIAAIKIEMEYDAEFRSEKKEEETN